MESATVLYVGRVGAKDQSQVEALQKRYTVLLACSGKQGLELLKSQRPQAIIVDAPSMRTHGERIVKQMRQHAPEIPILHIYPKAVQDLESPAELLLTAPYTARKLLNSVERLLKTRSDEVIACGPFSMNVPRRLLIAHGHEMQLNPKVALLVEVFLRNPNTTFDRETLMKTIWQTDYMGDTRTLDVHIRWARQALENGGGHRYVQTVRGVGYRLVLPTAATPQAMNPKTPKAQLEPV